MFLSPLFFRLTPFLISLFALTACGGGGSSTVTSSSNDVTTVPGAPTIGVATAGSRQASIAFSAPASSGGVAVTAYTASCVTGSTAAVTGTGVSSPISVTGLADATVYLCTVSAANSVGSGAASAAVSVTTNAAPVTPTPAAVLTYSTPANFASAITARFEPTLALASSVASRSRYMISDSATASSAANYLSIGATYSAAAGFVVEPGTVSTSSTYNSYLTKLVQVMAAADGNYRLDSHLHPNNSIDVDVGDSLKLKFRNNFGKATSTYGYVSFAYSTSTRKLQAKKRYKYSYDPSTYVAIYTEDTGFAGAGYYVNYAGGVYKLVPLLADATSLYFYDSPLDLGVPAFMNPKAVAFVTNAAAAFKTKTTVSAVEGTTGSIYSQVNATYKPQVLTAGSDATTKINADARLALIKTQVEASGGSLRYAPAVYTAFRDAALKTQLVSDSIADGAPGQNLVPYVYFTNEKDTSGTYHPFMVVVHYGNQASPNGLKDVPHPPGDGTGAYPASKVTRFTNLENYVTLIPMRNYGQVLVVTDNTFTRNLWLDVPTTTLPANVYTYADSADNGLLIDGSVMFPVFNNTLVPSHLAGELSASGCHVGQGGGGPHCHADGYQAGSALGLYNDSDYVGFTHPPLIGFGYDGIALFAKYRSSDSALLGYTTALGEFGAHDHDGLGYHYHAHTVPDYQPVGASTADKSTLHVLMKGAYIGKTNEIPFFRTNSGFRDNIYLGGQ
jgi:hypothetical protein